MKQQIKVVPSGNRGCPRKQTHPGEGSFWDLDLSCYSPPLELSSWGTTDLLRVYFEMMFSLVQRRLGNDLSPQSWPTHHSSWSPPHRLSSLPLPTSSSPSTPNVLSFSLPRQAVVPSVLISHTRPIPSVFLSLPPFTPVTADQLLPLWEKGSCEHIKSLPVADPLPSGATPTLGPIGPLRLCLLCSLCGFLLFGCPLEHQCASCSTLSPLSSSSYLFWFDGSLPAKVHDMPVTLPLAWLP